MGKDIVKSIEKEMQEKKTIDEKDFKNRCLELAFTLGLNRNQKKFGDLIVEGYSQVRAYLAVYPDVKYNIASSSASKLANHTNVRKYIDQASFLMHTRAMEKYEVTIDRIYQELTRLSYWNIKDFFDDDGNQIPLNLLDDDKARAIVSIDLKGRYVFADKGQNLDRLAKAQGMFQAEKTGQQVVILNPPEINKPKNSGVYSPDDDD